MNYGWRCDDPASKDFSEIDEYSVQDLKGVRSGVTHMVTLELDRSKESNEEETVEW
jgi:hypothetical protein